APESAGPAEPETTQTAEAITATATDSPTARSVNGRGHANGTNGASNGSLKESLRAEATTALYEPVNSVDAQLSEMMGDAPFCDQCGHITVRNGSCDRCLNCGNSLGCS